MQRWQWEALPHDRVAELGGGENCRLHVEAKTGRILNDAGERVDAYGRKTRARGQPGKGSQQRRSEQTAAIAYHGRPTRARGAPGTGPSAATSPADFSDGGGIQRRRRWSSVSGDGDGDGDVEMEEAEAEMEEAE